MFELPKIIKRGPSQKDKLNAEKQALETKGFNAGNDKLKSMMEAQNNQTMTPEQMAAAQGQGRD